MVKAIVLQRSKVAESWSCIIENANGNAARIYRSTAAAILSANLPDVYLERAIVRPTLWSRGEEREYLLVTNLRFTEYPIYIGAKDYGNNLAIHWYLVVSESLFTALSAGDLNLFQLQDLEAHVTVIHRCLRKAVADLLLSFGQDTSQLEPKSKGFLGVIY
jgi:hypothetical protein